MSLNHNSKFRGNWLWISLVLLAVGIGFGLVLPTGMQLAREADERADAMYDAYCEARFDVALTAVSDYIAYLEKHERKIARYRKTDSMLAGAHLQAGFMLLHTEDVTRAQEHLSAAYEYLQKVPVGYQYGTRG